MERAYTIGLSTGVIAMLVCVIAIQVNFWLWLMCLVISYGAIWLGLEAVSKE